MIGWGRGGFGLVEVPIDQMVDIPCEHENGGSHPAGGDASPLCKQNASAPTSSPRPAVEGGPSALTGHASPRREASLETRGVPSASPIFSRGSGGGL